MAERLATLHRLPSGAALLETRYVLEDDHPARSEEDPDGNITHQVVLCRIDGQKLGCSRPLRVHQLSHPVSTEGDEVPRARGHRPIPGEARVTVEAGGAGDRVSIPIASNDGTAPTREIYRLD
jgi:hypothetical protein